MQVCWGRVLKHYLKWNKNEMNCIIRLSAKHAAFCFSLFQRWIFKWLIKKYLLLFLEDLWEGVHTYGCFLRTDFQLEIYLQNQWNILVFKSICTPHNCIVAQVWKWRPSGDFVRSDASSCVVCTRQSRHDTLGTRRRLCHRFPRQRSNPPRLSLPAGRIGWTTLTSTQVIQF